MMNTVRFGVVGLGNMGLYHCNYLDSLEGAKLTAIHDIDTSRLDAAKARFSAAKPFPQWQDLIASGEADAVIVATPHYKHPEITIAALDRDLHVICEKPAAVTVTGARQMAEAAAKKPHLKFAINFQMRANPVLRKIRDLVQAGDLGELNRITWIVTNWFRTNAYYASGGWRATWAGEGGGVLINQCPHNLDQLYWLTGMMPSSVTAVAHIGKTHPIEVEDEVSAILEYAGGATGHFITSTGEAPGTDRLEIAGDRGRIVSEGGKLSFRMNRQGVRAFRETSTQSFAAPEAWDVEIPVTRNENADNTRMMTQNFVAAVLRNEPLIAPGGDGVKGLEIGNAMLMSGITRKRVDLPLDGAAVDAFIAEMGRQYGGKKSLETRAAGTDMSASFGRTS